MLVKYLDLRQHASDVAREFIEETIRKRTEQSNSLIEKLSAECDRVSELMESERQKRYASEDDNDRLRNERFRMRQMIRHIVAARINESDKDITALMNSLRDTDEENEIAKISEDAIAERSITG